jgi:serine/threonine-protein kinase
MLGPGPAKLIDFGIASRPHDGNDDDTSIGSLRFMSPEQLHGEALTPASDLFSLGAVLYDALTGRPPYGGETPEEISAAQAAGSVRPPSTLVDGVPDRLEEAILQALRRDPDARFTSADAMEASLAASAGDIATGEDDDTTQVIRVPPPPPSAAAGYVPPAAPPAPSPDRPAPREARPPRRRSAWGALGTILILGAAALVAVLIIVPLLDLGREGGGGRTSPAAAPTREPGSNAVLVPRLVGASTAEALAAARASGLDWTLYCNEDGDQPAGIIDQEPPAGAEVPPGSTFSLYSARFDDCQ